MKTIKIFLASSEELRQERLELADMVEHLNNALERQDISVRLVKWEYLDASMGSQHKQEEYNDKLRECEMCLVIYGTKFGMYTKTELDTAYRELCAGNNPKKLYVYFKTGTEPSAELQSFRDSFPNQYGHFFCHFENIDTLKSHFLLQFLEYQGKRLGGSNIIEVRDSQVIVDGKAYADLKNVPFAGNNEEYNALIEEIELLEDYLEDKATGHPRYAEKAERLLKLKEKRAQMEHSLWDTALMITRLSTTRCSERLQRAMELFSNGDNKGARAILNEEDIERDARHNINLIKLGEEGKAGLKINIEEYRLKIKTLENGMAEGWGMSVVDLHKKIMDWSETLYGARSLEYADSLYEAGNTYSLLRSDEEMLKISLKAFEIRREILGEEHPDTAASCNNIGVAYGHLGDYEKELEYGFKTLSIRKKVLGEEHPDTATSYDNIGVAYGHLGDYEKELEYSLKALAIRKKVLGDEHPDTAESCSNIGVAYGDLGDYEKFLEYSLKALAIRKKVLGDEHPDTAESYNNISVAYGHLGDYEKELEYGFKDLAILEKVLGEEHPDTAVSYNNIGCAYGNLGDCEKGLEYCLKALAIREKVLGVEHPDTARSYDSIGCAYGDLGDYEKGLEYFLKALAIREKVLGAEHPDTVTSYYSISGAYIRLGDYEKGVEYSLKALAIEEKDLS